MSSSEDVWETRVLNPDALGDREKEIWTEIEPILVELLDELKTKGKIESSFVDSETQHLKNVLDNLTQVSKNYNMVVHLFDNVERFLKVNTEFGFGDKELANLYVETTVLLCILNTELFKILLLFHLKGVNHKPSQLNSTLGQFAPKTWKKLKPYVDSDFRNSLAHGTWALENKQIVLFKDAKLVPYEKLDLDEFIIRAKKQNVLFQCLINVLASKRKANFFT